MTSGLSYRVEAATLGGGVSEVRTKQSVVRFDSSPRQGEELPGPADLLTAAFAACVLKNVERMAEAMPFQFETARVEVRSQRQDRPPKMVRIVYDLTVATDEDPRRVELLHDNIRKHGTIFNTLAAVCDVSGDIRTVAPPRAG